MRAAMRAVVMAAWLAFAPSEASGWWLEAEGRPAAVLLVGEPVVPLQARPLLRPSP